MSRLLLSTLASIGLLLLFPIGSLSEGVCPQGPYHPENCHTQHDCERWEFCYNGYCCNTTAFEHPERECVDLRDDCAANVDKCWNDVSTRVQFYKECYKTCGYCKSDCVDRTDPAACAFFGGCYTLWPIYNKAMYNDCKRYCGYCSLDAPPSV